MTVELFQEGKVTQSVASVVDVRHDRVDLGE